MERTTADRVADPIIGRSLDDRYRILQRIARGGMATVYEAVDTRLDRAVAVKVMHEGLRQSGSQEEEFSQRFRREAQAAARLAHQNVVAVFDQGDDDGTLYLVMEYVPGITLRDLVRAEAPIAPLKTLMVVEPVLEALAAAHRAGMIHRDVKPENVLLADDGRVKVADFGLARAINAETQHTSTGVLIGTVSYLSPELVVAGEADARADVYAVGVLLYEMLTGEKPHQAETPIQVAYKHVHEDIPPPSARVPGLPAYLDALVARATARDTSLRPRDAGVLLHQVHRVHSALAAGVVDDPDLVEDLLPVAHRRDPFVDTDDQMPRVIIDPSQDTASWSPLEDSDGFDAVAIDDAYAGSGYQDFAPYSSGTEPTSAINGAAAVAMPPAPEPARVPPQRPPGPQRPRPRRSRRGPIMLIGLLVAALAVGVGAWYFGIARYTNTPGVINLAQADAKDKITQAGLKFKVGGQAYSTGVPQGAVVSTNPDPGSRILKGHTVAVTISRGPETHAVPDVRGRTLDKAQQMLQDAKLSYGNATEQYSQKVAEGKVITTNPVPGTQLRGGSPVDVVVSKGKKPIDVPNYIGQDVDTAIAGLKQAGFKVSRKDVYSDSVPAGIVGKQTPQGGTLFRGASVGIVVSKGPQMVLVPKTVGLDIARATARLKKRGFQVATTNAPTYVGLNIVVASTPDQGTMAPKGSTITLTLT
ncbi:Stk1 family PASTA domain-containing Ser/Thr kinase [Nocardioides mangrovicus]|uniref:Stk1 family PASTA domain-containing Ser/Thr kinase n=1 Tax=Nocardioides mangrovicus TaxID=2478913 RepID=UPI001E488768|nr:Stk1 family PASTA domain-containing Ser/Thr kinase [Nocardioides mangrovicus]